MKKMGLGGIIRAISIVKIGVCLSIFLIGAGIVSAEETSSVDTSNSQAASDSSTDVPDSQYLSGRSGVTSDSYYGSDNKSMLDENVRYMKTPSSPAGFGLIREKRIRLKLDSSFSYDSNIFLAKDDVKDDFITTISPGMYAYRGNDNYMLLGFYEADVLLYSKNPKETRINQAIGGRVDLFKTSLVKVSFKDTLRPTTNPATSELTQFVKRVNNEFGATVRYDMSPKTSFEFNYNQEIQYYLSNDYKSFNYVQHMASPVFYYHLSPKTSLSAEYNLGVTHYMGSSDYNSLYNQVRVGIEGELTQKSKVAVRGGYQYRSYENSNTKNTGGFVLEGVYNYSYSEKTSFTAIASSSINESVFSDVGYYKSYNLYIAMNHHILYNLDLDVSGLYIRADYPHEAETAYGEWKKRSDNLYGVSMKLTYSLRAWICAYAGYDFKFRQSNMRDFEYTDSIFSGGVKLSF